MDDFERGIEICVFCEGTKYKTKSWCAHVKANAHCRCCHEFFGIDKTPCIKE